MADRRSSATKSAGQAPSTTQTSKQKAADAVATQQANKGLSQKQLALKYGGRYSEGGTVYQVGAPTQQDSRSNEQRNAQFEALKEQASQKIRESAERNARAEKESKQQTSTSKYAYDEYGEASAPPIKREAPTKGESTKQVFFGPERQQNKAQQSSFITPATISQQPSFIHPGLLAQQPQPERKNIVQLAQEKSPLYKVLGSPESFQTGIYRGALEIASVGVAVGTAVIESAKQGKLTGIEKGSQEAIKFVEKYKPAEYPTGSREDIKQKIGSVVPFLVVSRGDAGVKGAVGAVGTISKRLQVSKVERFLAKTEPGIVSGREKLGEGSYLISRGTEKTPAKIPYTLVEFGKRGFKKQPGIATPIIPSEVAPLSPSRMFIRGKLDPTSQKLLGTKQTGPFTYEAAKTTPAGRQTYQRGVFEKQLKVIAEAKPTLIKDIGSPKFHKEFGEPGGRTVFGETKAERFNVIKSSLESRGVKPSSTTRSTTPFSFGISSPAKVGAGSAGKARGFSAQESRVIKESLSTKPITKQQPDILFSSPRFIVPSSILMQQTQEQAVRYPPTEKTINIFTNPLQTPGQKTLIPQITTPKITQPPIQIPTTKQTPTTKLIPPSLLNPPTTKLVPPVTLFPPIQVPIQPQIHRPIFRIDTPTKQITTTILQPPLLIPPKPPLEPPLKFPKILPWVWVGERHGYSGPDGPLGEGLNWAGNVPESQVEGMFKGFDIKYSNFGYPRLPKIKPEKKKSRSQRFFSDGIGYNTPNIISLTGNTKKSKPSSKGKSFFSSKSKSKSLGFSSKKKAKFF